MTKTFRHGNLAAALLQAGREELEILGHERLSLRALAENVGVSCGAPYRHFQSKEALLEVLRNDGRREISRRYSSAFEIKASAAQRLREACRLHIEFAMARPRLYQLMFVDLTHWSEHSVPSEGLANYELFTRLVKEAAKGSKLDTPQLAAACWSLIHGFSLLQISGRLKLAGNVERLKAGILDAVGRLVACAN